MPSRYISASNCTLPLTEVAIVAAIELADPQRTRQPRHVENHRQASLTRPAKTAKHPQPTDVKHHAQARKQPPAPSGKIFDQGVQK